MAYEVYIPQITAAVFSQNPAAINSKIVLTVRAADILTSLEAEKIYSGEIYAGEAR